MGILSLTHHIFSRYHKEGSALIRGNRVFEVTSDMCKAKTFIKGHSFLNIHC